MKPDKNIAESQASAIDNKARSWRAYLKKLADELNTEEDFTLLRMTSLWASTFSYIEWLATFYTYKSPKNISEIAPVLKQSWNWDEEVSRMFWAAGRNPVAHVGQTNPFHSFRRFNGLPTNVGFDSQNRWSEAATGEWDKYHPFRAVAILPLFDDGEKKIQTIYFFHQMLLEELLPKLAEDVVSKIANEKNQESLQKIYELNQQILH